MRTNLLFICTKNEWRSLTAEHIFRNHPRYSVRSAGTGSDARVQVKAGDIEWAEVVFVMERKHQEILRNRFPELMQNKNVICLDIPDEYEYMDEELVLMLEESVTDYFSTTNSHPGRQE